MFAIEELILLACLHRSGMTQPIAVLALRNRWGPSPFSILYGNQEDLLADVGSGVVA